jgi:hypothetical protein
MTYGRAYEREIFNAFKEAALFLLERVKKDGWTFRSNYLREHARCATGLKFTNTISPTILRRLRREIPELEPYIEISTLKDHSV